MGGVNRIHPSSTMSAARWRLFTYPNRSQPPGVAQLGLKLPEDLFRDVQHLLAVNVVVDHVSVVPGDDLFGKGARPAAVRAFFGRESGVGARGDLGEQLGIETPLFRQGAAGDLGYLFRGVIGELDFGGNP